MKWKTAIIGGIVSISLAAGCGYGAYYFGRSGTGMVEVVPVSNINQLSLGDELTVFGTISTRVSQAVALDQQYGVEQVYVSEGDTVKEGDPLFSYNMELQEIELEIERLSLQTEKLTLERLERELAKLKKNPATASLEHNSGVRTASADDGGTVAWEGLIEDAGITEKRKEGELKGITEDGSGNTAVNPVSGNENGSDLLLETVPASETEGKAENFPSSESGNEGEILPPPESGDGSETLPPAESESGSELPPLTESGDGTDVLLPSESETENSTNIIIEETETEILTEENAEMEKVIKEFLDMWETLRNFEKKQEPEYIAGLEAAIRFYQENICEPFSQPDAETRIYMEDHRIKGAMTIYLTVSGQAERAEQLRNYYKEIGMAYAVTLITGLDAEKMTREELKKATAAYEDLGLSWQADLELRWQTELGTEWQGKRKEALIEDMEEQEKPSALLPSLADILRAYDVILTIQEVDVTAAEEELRQILEKLRDYYLALPEEAQALVWNRETLIELLKQYGLWEEEPPQEPDPGFGSWDGGGGSDYTPEELKTLIENKEQDIREANRLVREAELKVKEKQRVVDGKVVKSKLNGVVESIGSADGSSDGEYFVKISGSSGLYVKGAMNELALETIKEGDTITGTMSSSGTEFMAVVKEISKYPDPEGRFNSFGMENTNASYYPFYALIQDGENLEEGEAQIRLAAGGSGSDTIMIEKYFVRTDRAGKSYVMKAAENDMLEKQYVETGKSFYSSVEILQGLTLDDRIAFPYGKKAREGAAVQEVEQLEIIY